MNKKNYISWAQVEDFVELVYRRYRSLKISGVYGLPRGGLVLAVMLSHRLKVPMLMAPTPGCIIIDDICDSGESLLHFDKNSSGDVVQSYHIVTMCYKKNNLDVVPEFWYYEKQNDWIVFPWETKED